MIAPCVFCGVQRFVARRRKRLSVEMLFGIGTMRSSHSQPEPGFGGVMTSVSGSMMYRHSPGFTTAPEGMFDPVGDSVPCDTEAPLMVYVGALNATSFVLEPAPSRNLAGEAVPYAAGLPPGR